MGIFDNVSSVVINNKVVSSIVTSNGGVLYQKTNATSLSINVPLSLVYSDAFNITGYLKDSNNNGIVGETVNLKVGSTIVDSTTTTTGGAYSFTESPVSAGNHSFQVTYAGANGYETCSSSVVNRNIAKETTVLAVSLNKQKYRVGETATATIVLTDDDGTAINGATVNYTLGNTQSSTTTNSNGRATVTFTVQSSVTSISCEYPTNSNYSSSSDSKSFSIVTPTVLNVTSATPIIESGDSATINVALLDQDGDGIGSAVVSYSIINGSSTISTGTKTTNSSGQATISYTGTGVGDVSVIVSYGSLLQETYEIEDYLFYDDASIDKSSEYTATTPETSTIGYITHNTDNYSINGGNSVNSFNLEGIGQLTNCEIEITVKPTSTSFSGALGISFSTGNRNASGFMCYSNGNTRKVLYQNNSWVESYHKMYYNVTTQEGNYFTYKLIKQGNTITIPAINQSYTIPWADCYIGIMCGSGVNAFKKLKIKAL